MGRWKLVDAKNQFSRLVQAARRQPQIVTRHGREEVVVLSIEKYRRLSAEQRSLVNFLHESPLADALASSDLELVQSGDLARDSEL